MFNVRGERLPQQFSLGAECEGEGAIEAAAVFRDGLAVLTASGRIWCALTWLPAWPSAAGGIPGGR